MQVNRYLKDKHFDHIDHALGRPVDPMGETYREYFAANTRSKTAREMASSPHWNYFGSAGDMSFFEVTTAGREALRDHLKAIGDRHRAFSIAWGGMTSTVIAETRSKARYLAFLRISDVYPELTFREFQSAARVHIERQGATP